MNTIDISTVKPDTDRCIMTEKTIQIDSYSENKRSIYTLKTFVTDNGQPYNVIEHILGKQLHEYNEEEMDMMYDYFEDTTEWPLFEFSPSTGYLYPTKLF